MNITISIKEVSTMIDMLTLAGMLVEGNEEGYEEGNSPSKGEFSELKEKIFRAIKENGPSQLIEYDPIHKFHYCSQKQQSQSCAEQVYADFREEAFWEELAAHLAERDLLMRLGEERFEQLDDYERVEMTMDIENHYWHELENNGVDNLHIVHPQGS